SNPLGTSARGNRERLGRFQVLDHRAEINRFGIERFVFCDLGPVHDAETVTLEHFFAAPAFEGDDLAIDAFFAAPVEITQIRAHQRAGRRHLASVRLEVDVEMWSVSGRGRHFAPTVTDHPANETPRSLVVTT